MSERHICRLLILGLITEVALIMMTAIGGIWLLCWLTDHMPNWVVLPMFGLIAVIAVGGIWLDDKNAIEK